MRYWDASTFTSVALNLFELVADEPWRHGDAGRSKTVPGVMSGRLPHLQDRNWMMGWTPRRRRAPRMKLEGPDNNAGPGDQHDPVQIPRKPPRDRQGAATSPNPRRHVVPFSHHSRIRPHLDTDTYPWYVVDGSIMSSALVSMSTNQVGDPCLMGNDTDKVLLPILFYFFHITLSDPLSPSTIDRGPIDAVAEYMALR